MISPSKHTLAYTVSALILLLAGGATPAPAQTTLSATELKCSSKLGKATAKLAATYLRDMSRCRGSVVAGKTTGPCPDAATLSRLQGAIDKVDDTVTKSCTSTCTISGIECIADSLCPPSGAISETCNGAPNGVLFDMGNLGFPGAVCEVAIGRPITRSADLAACITTLTQQSGSSLIDAIYGGLDDTVAGPKDVQRCLSAISKASQKLVSTVFKGVIKCRDDINKGKLKQDPRVCAFSEEKLLSKIGKAKAKLRKSVDKRCESPAVLAALDVCGQGVGAMSNTSDVASCIIDATIELTDTQTIPALRTYGPSSFVEAVYPQQPVCGDDMVNQGVNAFLPLGEECDGTDDSNCPGACIPPGDLFECSCAGIPRTRFLGDGTFVDLDIGWVGSFHDLRIAADAGYIAEVSDCNCTAMNGAGCAGVSSDSVCNLQGSQVPRCEWDTSSGTRCDNHGDGDTLDEHNDCFVCDQFSDNVGALCSDSSECASRCYDALNNPLNACTSQADCFAGSVCRGRCDDSARCIELPNGAPTPSSAGGLSACTVTVYREDVTGTTDIVTGAHEIDMLQYSRVHGGVSASTPCPLCGGFCDGGSLDGEACLGRCSSSSLPCRFDSDCGMAQSCRTSSPDCPGGECNLNQVCSAGPSAGDACRIEAVNPVFGAVSSDCLPAEGSNFTGSGLTINWTPRTSAWVDAPGELACTAPGFELFTCPCPPGAGGAPTQPNTCAPSCDAGAEFGQGCGTGNSAGVFTTCAGGANAGKACDEDSDCPDSGCSTNPTHCVGDPAFERNLCTANSDCGLGLCVDACPAGRCVPLCISNPGDAGDGICAAGPPTFHCSALTDSFRVCGANEAAGDCNATCTKSGEPCLSDSECGLGEKCKGTCTLARLCEAGVDGELGTADDNAGAGICVQDNRHCSQFGIAGGDIFNGKGDPNVVWTVASFCLSATGSPVVNQAAGIGGPGRLRQAGINVTNGFQMLP